MSYYNQLKNCRVLDELLLPRERLAAGMAVLEVRFTGTAADDAWEFCWEWGGEREARVSILRAVALAASAQTRTPTFCFSRSRASFSSSMRFL